MSSRHGKYQRTFSRKISHRDDEHEFSSRQKCINATTVYLLRPPRSLSTDYSHRPCVIVPVTTKTDTTSVSLYHPITLKRQSWKLPKTFELSKFRFSSVAASHYVGINVDKLLVVPPPSIPKVYDVNNDNLGDCTLLVLYNGGQLRGCPRYGEGEEKERSSPWVKLSHNEKFDDIFVCKGEIYAVDRQGRMILINNHRNSRKISIGKTLITRPVTPGLGVFGWRKRVVVDGKKRYLVVRTGEEMFEVYELIKVKKAFNWYMVMGFEDNKVLFIARDYYFFMKALSNFPGTEYENCIVFTDAAFPEYGRNCWAKSGEDVAVFRLTDDIFAREGENDAFLKIDWTPPPWIYLAGEFHSPSDWEAVSQSECEHDEEEDLDLDIEDEVVGWTQYDLKSSNSEDEVGWVECDLKGSNSDYEPVREVQCDNMTGDLKGSNNEDETVGWSKFDWSVSKGKDKEQEETGDLKGSNNEDETVGWSKFNWKVSNGKDNEQEEAADPKGSNNENETVGWLKFNWKASNGKDNEQEETEYGSDYHILDQEQDEMESDYDGEYHEQQEMESDSHSQGQEQVKMGTNFESRDQVLGSLSAAGEEGIGTLLSMNIIEDGATEEETPTKIITPSKLKACTCTTVKKQEDMEADTDSQEQGQDQLEAATDSQDQMETNTDCENPKLASLTPASKEVVKTLLIMNGGDIATEKDNQDQDQMEAHSDNQGQDQMETNSDSEDQKPTSLTPASKEVIKTLLIMNGEDVATEGETSTENTTLSTFRACTCSSVKSHHQIDSGTTKFEGFDVRSVLVPTLQKIWQNHGNLIENSTLSSADIIARVLESLATVVQILEDNSPLSLSDGQVDYLTSTLSDLKCICFKVCWLIPSVDKAIQLHKAKPLVDSLNNLSELSSQVKERRSALIAKLDEDLAKLDEEESKLKEEMEKVSRLIPFDGQIKLDKPLELGLT